MSDKSLSQTNKVGDEIKRITILLIATAILSLIPYQVFAKPRVFITFSDFINNRKYSLYETKVSEMPSTLNSYKPIQLAQVSKTKRNIFTKSTIKKH